MRKTGWHNPDNGIFYSDMELPINEEHEKIRIAKIRRSTIRERIKVPIKDERLSPLEEQVKKIHRHNDKIIDEVNEPRYSTDYSSPEN